MEPAARLDQYGQDAVQAIAAAMRQRTRDGNRPFVVAIDGGSGSGKSTVAALLASQLGAVVVPTDDFYAAHITDDEWGMRDAVAKAADVLDWRRLRSEALEPLIAGRPARWFSFDFASGVNTDGTFARSSKLTQLEPAQFLLIDGVYSARPELSNLIDMSVLIDVPVVIRHQRLQARRNAYSLDAWHARWDEAEEHYLSNVRPSSSFDLVIENATR